MRYKSARLSKCVFQSILANFSHEILGLPNDVCHASLDSVHDLRPVSNWSDSKRRKFHEQADWRGKTGEIYFYSGFVPKTKLLSNFEYRNAVNLPFPRTNRFTPAPSTLKLPRSKRSLELTRRRSRPMWPQTEFLRSYGRQKSEWFTFCILSQSSRSNASFFTFHTCSKFSNQRHGSA